MDAKPQPSPMRHLRPRFALAISAALALAPAGTACAETPYDMINSAAAKSPVVVTPLGKGVSMLSGSGGNITVLTGGPDGTFMVDTGISVSRPKILEALKALNGGPIRYAVNTHWHWDHSDGNGWVKAAGATLLAHPRTIDHFGDTIRVVEWEHTFPPVAVADRPSIPVLREQVIRLSGQTARVRSLGDGHTDGDLIVRFEQANVMSLGDIWWNGIYPFIDYVVGGNIDRAIAQISTSIRLADNATRIVPGHGPVGTKADLIASRDMLMDVRARVAALKAKGLSLDQVIAAKPSAQYDAKWGASLVSPTLFVTLVYRGV